MANKLRKLDKNLMLALIITFSVIFIPGYVIVAQVMGSGSYQIRTDSINFGGSPSESANYKGDETLGEIATGPSNSPNYYMHAGYWAMQQSYIAINSPADLALAPIGGIDGEGSEGSITWQVTTDNFAGYTFSIKTNTVPALKSAVDSFANYVPTGADPDYNFTIPSNDSEFGFSPEGTDTNSRFLDNGIDTCNTGSSETTGKCWDGLSTSDQTIAGKSSSNHPSGSSINVRFRAESGSAHIQTSGSYSASIEVTALTL